jgi:hypothetical protein
MSFEPPAGILDIGNATLRVGKLEVSETLGLNQGLQNIVKNNLLITETTSYTTNQKWGLKLPTTWVGEFEVKGHTGKYIDFNFYNENSASNAQGYNLTFKDTTMTLRYDGGSALGGGAATIPTIVGAFRKVNIFFERGVLAVSIDGTRYLYHKETDGFNNGVGAASRVVSATGGAFVNLFIEANAADSAFKNLRIVNDRFISDKTSNIAFVGGNLGVGVHSPQEALDIRGNMHFNRVSNVSSVSVDSNVVAEYTGPHDRPLRKYPESLTDRTVTSSSDNQSGNAFNFSYSDIGWHPDTDYTSGTGYADGTTTTTDVDSNQYSGEWTQVQLPTHIKLQEMRIFYRYADSQGRQVEDGTVLGSVDGSSWTRLYTFDGFSGLNSTSTPHVLHINDTRYYNYIRLVVERVTSGANGDYTSDLLPNIVEIELYGHEEGDSSLDTTLKSVYNVPGTQQLEVYYDAKDLADGAVSTTSGAITGLGGTTINGTAFGDPQVSNGAFVFDGSGDYIRGQLSSFGGEQTFTFSLWFNMLEEVSGNNSIFQIGSQGSGEEGIGFRVQTGSAFRMYTWGGPSNFDVGTVVPKNWYHVVGIYSGGVMTLYVDGNILQSTSGSSLNLPADPYFALGVQLTSSGTEYSTSGFNGSIANFRLFSKALNADQVRELYDYQKDYFLGTRSSVTLYKGHLGIGVAEPSGQLELAGDERIQEYPPGPMSNFETLIPGHGVFCASASDEYDTAGTYSPWKAFTKNTTSYFITDGAPTSYNSDGTPTGISRFEGVLGSWLKLKLPYDILLRRINIARRFDYGEYFSTALLYGSVDDVSWDVLHNIQMPAAYTNVDFEINATKVYKYFVVQITKGGGTSYQNIGEWRLFGTPGPTTLDKGSLTLGRSLDVPRISRYDVDTETPRPEKLLLDFDTTVNSSPTDISGQGNHGTFYNGASYSAADKAFNFDGTNDYIDVPTVSGVGTGAWVHSKSFWFKLKAVEDGILFLLGSNSSTRQIAVQRTAAGQFQYYIYGCNSRVQVNGVDWVPDLNRWYHCVAVFKNNETTAGGSQLTGREMYIDGVKQTLVAINTQVSLDLNTTGVRFGNQYNTVYQNYQLSNPKLYNVALEASEAKKLYNLGRTGRSMVISDTAVGIGKVPEAQLDVKGTIKGMNMTTCPVFFDATATASTASGADMNFDSVNASFGGGLSGTTFTAPIRGYYYFSIFFMGAHTSGEKQLWVSFMKNGAEEGLTVNNARIYDHGTTAFGSGARHGQNAGSAIIFLNGTGDYVQMRNKGTIGSGIHGQYNRFQGIYLSA